MAMHRTSALYSIDRELATYLPFLTPRLRQGLRQWVVGTVVAENGCQDAVTAALGPQGNPHTRRRALRECLYDDGDRITSWGSGQELDVELCFPALLRWVRAWWVPAGRQEAEPLWLAADPTPLQDRLVALVVSVLYRNHAIPVAWAIVGAHAKTSWHDRFQHLLRLLAPAVSPGQPVHVLCDMGLNRRSLWDPIVALGWHPCVRFQAHLTFCPQGQVPRCDLCQRRRPCRQGCGLRLRARALPGGPGGYGVGAGTAFRQDPLPCTLVALHGWQAPPPWLLLTDTPPAFTEASLYACRHWIEQGFRGLKTVGGKWHRTRRLDPIRVARHWLVLAVATLLAVAYGTRCEEARDLGRDPGRLRRPARRPGPVTAPRRLSVLQQGVHVLCALLRGYVWARVWLRPLPGPDLTADLQNRSPPAAIAPAVGRVAGASCAVTGPRGGPHRRPTAHPAASPGPHRTP